MKKINNFALLLALLVPLCCQQRKNITINYWEQGFINDNTLQFIFTVQADEKEIGLNNRRATAEKEAELQLRQNALDSLSNYLSGSLFKSNAKINIDVKNIDNDQKSVLNKVLSRYLTWGHVVMRYYGENESIVFVYRITKKNLKDLIIRDIENIFQGNGKDTKS